MNLIIFLKELRRAAKHTPTGEIEPEMKACNVSINVSTMIEESVTVLPRSVSMVWFSRVPVVATDRLLDAFPAQCVYSVNFLNSRVASNSLSKNDLASSGRSRNRPANSGLKMMVPS